MATAQTEPIRIDLGQKGAVVSPNLYDWTRQLCRPHPLFLTVSPQPVMTVIPGWTTDSVPGFTNHVWAPDAIQWHGQWWLAYSCSTFGKNGSAIGLLSSRSLRSNMWKDEDIFICHGYSATQNGAALLIQRPIKWTTDGWPEL